MKSLIFVCVSLFVGLSVAEPLGYSRGCIYILGRCHEECPVGTHSYSIGCGRFTPEPTCAEPSPVEAKGILCDYSSCYCDPPTLRDEKTGKCVLKEECSPQDSTTNPTPATTLLPPYEEPKIVSEHSEPPSESETLTAETTTDAAVECEDKEEKP